MVWRLVFPRDELSEFSQYRALSPACAGLLDRVLSVVGNAGDFLAVLCISHRLRILRSLSRKE